MKISQSGLKLVKAFESCMKAIGGGRFRAYVDPVGVLTIGWGHTNHHTPKFNAETVWTQQECDQALTRDMAIFEGAVNRLVKVPLKQHQFDALVSFSYNCGEGNLSKSGLLRKVNAGDFQGAALEFPKWNKGGGRVLPGLVRRRASESLLFQGIPDLNYDGRADGPMARRVDPPRTAPTTKDTGLGGGAGAAAGGIAAWLGAHPVVIVLAIAVVAAVVIFGIRYLKKEK